MLKDTSFFSYVANILSHQFQLKVSPERMAMVRKDIEDNSMPEVRFYVMVLVSTMIAGFGLVSDSTAVVIGAMLVAPLMTPIFGISLALVRGDSHLLKQALQAEFLGVLMAVAMGILVGVVMATLAPHYQATHEMLSRTQPNLFDLVVAVLAGFAGAYALIDEKISPALPGVAIATAIVPPLANCGLCIGYGAYHGALGSFLLFFANFLSILLVSSVLFYKAGMAMDLSKMAYIRRFGLATICFIFMACFLGHSLHVIIQESKLRTAVRSIMTKELGNFATSGLNNLRINFHQGTLFVLAQVYSSTHFDPYQVEHMEENLSEKLNRPAKLIIRQVRSSDISSNGSNSLVIANNLDGFSVSQNTTPDVQTIRQSTQVIREFLSKGLGFNLEEVNLLHLKFGPTIICMISGYRNLSQTEVRKMVALVRKATGIADLRVMVRNIQVSIMTGDGPIRYGWNSLSKLTEKQEAQKREILLQIASEFSKNDEYLVTHVNSVIKDHFSIYLVEVEGSGSFTRNDLQQLQTKLQAVSDEPVTLYVWLNHGAVMTANGLRSYETLSEARIKSFEKKGKEWIKKVLESAQ